MAESQIDIRPLTEHEEFLAAVELQRAIWGFSDVELLPVRMFVVATKVGGVVIGAFDQSRMIGFSIGIPGIKPGGQGFLHSNMLGVLPEYHNHGLGRGMKLRQREEALKNGIQLIEWTFDPLEIKNAYFNIERLGAIVRRYVPNQYGTTSSPLHGGLPTDRCIAEWWLESPRVAAALRGETPARAEIAVSIDVPNDIAALRKSDPKAARDVQKRVGDGLQEHFARGLAVLGLARGEHAASYQLGAYE